MIETVRAAIQRRPWLADVTIAAAITAIAAALRLARLGDIPYGVHPDEAQLGTDVHRILDGDFIGVYTTAVLGQPSGHAYIALPSIWLLGDTAFALRLPLALVALAAVPLLYALVRITLGRTEAAFASLLLAVSWWHLFYSRVAHWSISYGTVLLGVLLLLMLGVQRRHHGWFVASGALLGAGVYTYNVYPIAVLAVAACLAFETVRRRHDADVRRWLTSLGLMSLAAFVVALPMFMYLSNPDAFYWTHVDDYRDTGVLRSNEFREASSGERARLIAQTLRDNVASYTYHGHVDFVDGNGTRPVLDPPMLLLLAAGAIMAFLRRREPMIVAAICCLVIIPLPATLQQGSVMRQPVAVAPYVALLAALPLAAIWRTAMRAQRSRAALAVGAVAAIVSLIAGMTVHSYFSDWQRGSHARYVYHQEITAASEYMADLPEGAYVYFYSDRHPFNLETRLFLAPHAQGEDRSFEFSTAAASIDGIDRARTAVFVLLPGYAHLLASIEAAYPGGTERAVYRRGYLDFAAYELPPLGVTPP